MLEYLVSSKTRRSLLQALWRDGAKGTASSLARRTGMPFGATYEELKQMSRAGLAHESLESGRLVYEARRDNPCAAALSQLFRHSDKVTAPKTAVDRDSDVVRTELAAHGAALWRRAPDGGETTRLEELLAKACELAHRDPSVAKVLPHLFLSKKNSLSFDRLEHALTENKQKHTAGFLLAVAAALSGDETLDAWAERLRDKRRTRLGDFFTTATASKRLQALADRNTPALARAWNFRLNMSMDDFSSVIEKFPR